MAQLPYCYRQPSLTCVFALNSVARVGSTGIRRMTTSSVGSSLQELFSLEGTRAVVTGASSGIGQRMALTLARAGAQVLLVGRRSKSLQQLVLDHPHLHERLLPLPLDLTVATAISQVAEAAEALGGCDIVVHAAGIVGRNTIAELDTALFEQVQHLNVAVPAQLSSALLPLLRQSRAGRVIMIASIFGLAGQLCGALVPYVISKHALVGLTRSLAIEWGPYGITVNAIAPGHVPTEITAEVMKDPQWVEMHQSRYLLGRFGRVEDMDTGLLFLASPHSAFVTGITLPIDGGWTAR